MSRPDRGAALLLGVVLAQLLMMVALGGALVGALVVERARVGSVADLAALAAAEAGDAACLAADATARMNELALSACARDGPDVVITLTGPVPAPLTGLLLLMGQEGTAISVSARAGPP